MEKTMKKQKIKKKKKMQNPFPSYKNQNIDYLPNYSHDGNIHRQSYGNNNCNSNKTIYAKNIRKIKGRKKEEKKRK